MATLAVAPDARAAIGDSWGHNQWGEVGDGTTNERSTPGMVSGMSSGVTSIAGGGQHSLAVRDGAVYSWGNNNAGQLGDNSSSSLRTTPFAVIGLSSGVNAVAAGGSHSLALQNGAVYAWGNDQGPSTYDYIPTAVSGLSSGVTAIAAGNAFSLALQNQGVYAWGLNGVNQLGDGTTTSRTTPVAVTGLSSGVTAIAAGRNHSLAVQNSAVYAWGYNDFGQIGDGSTSTRATPVAVTGLSNGVTAVACSAFHSLAVRNGAVYAWGGNFNGELGDGTRTTSLLPEQIDPTDLHDIIAVAAGINSSYALSSDGSIWDWGYNLGGQLGVGTFNVDYLTPQHVLPPSGYLFTSIDADSEGDHAVATLAVAPEPSSLTIVASSFIGFAVRRRRSVKATGSASRRSSWVRGCRQRPNTMLSNRSQEASLNTNRSNLVPVAPLRAAAFSLASLAALAIACLRPACVLASTPSQFQTVFAGPVSGPAYPAPAVKTGLLNLNSFPPSPIYQQNEVVSLAVLNAFPPGPTAPPIETALTTHVDAASPTLSFFNLFYPPGPVMPAGTFLLSYQAINPRNQANLPMALIGLENVTPTSFDLLFSADIPQEIQGDNVPSSPAGLETHTLHATAMQGLTFSNVQAPALGNFVFDFSGGTVDPNTPIMTATLSGDFTAVPEPSAFMLAGLGLAGLVHRGRRRRKTPLAGLLLTAFVAITASAVMTGAARAQVFVTSGNSIGEYNATTGATVNAALVSGLSTPEGLAISGSKLFVSNFNTKTVGVYTTAGATLNAALLSTGNAPDNIAIFGSNLFVSNFTDGTIGEYDATTGAVINATLVTGLNAPMGIAMSGGNLFVTDLGGAPGTGTIGEYNATTGATINPALVTGLNGPQGIEVSGSNLFVANHGLSQNGVYIAGSGSIGEYTLSGATVNPPLITGLNFPEQIALSGDNLFVTNYLAGTIGQYTTSGATVNAALVSGLDHPHGIAVVPEPSALMIAGLGLAGLARRGRRRRKTPLAGLLLAVFAAATTMSAFPDTVHAQIVVADFQAGTIGQYNATTGAAQNATLITGLNHPAGIAVSGSNLFVTNFLGGTIGQYTTSGTPVNAALVAGLNSPIGVAVSGSDLFVVSQGGTIGRYNATTGAAVNSALITGLNAPAGIAVSGQDLFITNQAGNTIGEYTSSGATVNASLISGLNNPVGVSVSGGNLFVANYTIGTIGEYDAITGATVNASLVTGLVGPEGIAVSGGNLFVTYGNFGGSGSNGKVGEYNATTGATVNAALVSGLIAPEGIAVVPEPSAFMIVALGFAALMICRRFRRRAFASAALPSFVTPSASAGSACEKP